MLKVSRIVLPLLFAAVLIGGLITWSGLSLAQFVGSARAISSPAIVGILACTMLFLILSSLKWRLVMAQITPREAPAPSWILSLYYTSLGSLLALVITPHAAMPLSRSLGAKLYLKGAALPGAAASAYEQLFDVVPLVTMSMAVLIAIVVKASFGGWLAIALALNAGALVAMMLVLRSRFWSLAAVLPLPRRHAEKLAQKLQWFAAPAARTLLGPEFVATLFAISLTRYAVILLRTGFVMAAVGPPISGFQYLKAYGLARLSSLVSITPGELGISEWTWTGVLSWMGFRADAAARFVLVNRAYNVASLVAVFVFVWVCFCISPAIGSAGERRHAKEC